MQDPERLPDGRVAVLQALLHVLHDAVPVVRMDKTGNVFRAHPQELADLVAADPRERRVRKDDPAAQDDRQPINGVIDEAAVRLFRPPLLGDIHVRDLDGRPASVQGPSAEDFDPPGSARLVQESDHPGRRRRTRLRERLHCREDCRAIVGMNGLQHLLTGHAVRLFPGVPVHRTQRLVAENDPAVLDDGNTLQGVLDDGPVCLFALAELLLRGLPLADFLLQPPVELQEVLRPRADLPVQLGSEELRQVPRQRRDLGPRFTPSHDECQDEIDAAAVLGRLSDPAHDPADVPFQQRQAQPDGHEEEGIGVIKEESHARSGVQGDEHDRAQRVGDACRGQDKLANERRTVAREESRQESADRHVREQDKESGNRGIGAADHQRRPVSCRVG